MSTIVDFPFAGHICVLGFRSSYNVLGLDFSFHITGRCLTTSADLSEVFKENARVIEELKRPLVHYGELLQSYRIEICKE